MSNEDLIIIKRGYLEAAAMYLEEAVDYTERIRRQFGETKSTMGNNAGMYDALAKDIRNQLRQVPVVSHLPVG